MKQKAPRAKRSPNKMNSKKSPPVNGKREKGLTARVTCAKEKDTCYPGGNKERGSIFFPNSDTKGGGPTKIAGVVGPGRAGGNFFTG